MDIFRKKFAKCGFTLAEALVLLLVTALIIIATMPVITKKKRRKFDHKYGPPGGWICRRSDMPCTLNPPAKARNFAVYFNNELVPTFNAVNIGNITITASSEPVYQDVTYTVEHPPAVGVDKGDGWQDFTWDLFYGEPLTPEDTTYPINGYTETKTKRVLVNGGGCGSEPELYSSMDVYKAGTPPLKGNFCSPAGMVRIVY